MTRIDFYVSAEDHPQARQLLACRLAEKAYKLGHRVYIHGCDAGHCQQLDDLLWTFRDGSFIPHHSDPQNLTNCAPVIIGHGKELHIEADVLINLGEDIPSFFSQFERVAELVHEDAEVKNQARERYKFYRDRGYELQTHNL